MPEQKHDQSRCFGTHLPLKWVKRGTWRVKADIDHPSTPETRHAKNGVNEISYPLPTTSWAYHSPRCEGLCGMALQHSLVPPNGGLRHADRAVSSRHDWPLARRYHGGLRHADRAVSSRHDWPLARRYRRPHIRSVRPCPYS